MALEVKNAVQALVWAQQVSKLKKPQHVKGDEDKVLKLKTRIWQ